MTNTVTYENTSIIFVDRIPGRVTYFHRNGKFYESRMLEYIRSLNLIGTYVDVGANVGNHSVYFSHFCNASEILSIEPIPEIYNALKENISLSNKIKTTAPIKPLNVAASSKEGDLGLQYNLKERGSTAKTLFGGGQSITKAITLDSLLKNNKDINLIKIDVEGFEEHVLLGARKVLMKNRPELFIEIHGRSQRKRITGLLRAYGYQPIRIFNASPTYYFSCKPRSVTQRMLDKFLLALSQYRIFRWA